MPENVKKLGLDFETLPVISWSINLSEDGSTNIKIENESRIPKDNHNPDAITVLVKERLDENTSEKTAHDFVARLAAWLRVLTGQYWIGRNFDTQLSCIALFPVADDQSFGATVRVTGPPFYVSQEKMLPVTMQVLRAAVRRFPLVNFHLSFKK